MPRVTITVPEKTPQPYRFQLDRKSVTLGRGSDNDIAMDCGSISVKHAEMRRVKGGYELRDLGSTNGIKLDEERHQVIPLSNGLSVKMGDVIFDFVLGEDELEALAAEQANGGFPMELPPMMDPPVARKHTAVSTPVEAGGGGIGMIVLFLILALAAFVAGMAIRFQKETGGSMIEAIQSKSSAAIPPAAPKAAE